jgi:peptidoglycan LD-endopeptidase LytH
LGFSLSRSIVLALLLAAGAWAYHAGLDNLREYAHLFHGTPRQQYAALLTLRGGAASPAGRIWVESARTSLIDATPVTLPAEPVVSSTAYNPAATSFVVPLRRGQRYVVEARVDGEASDVFVDLFARDEEAVRHVASAAKDSTHIAVDIASDGEYVVRVQAPLDQQFRAAVTLRAEPSLRLPVDRSASSSIQSFFNAPRDGGRRAHQGVDIFAKRGTLVTAAADGFVSSTGTNRLGGNVVWVARPLRREFHYYAHLDRQFVEPGTFVKAGDVIGTVGNTGNARTTPPHLHFGIYTAAGAVDPLPYISAVGGRTIRARKRPDVIASRAH